MSWLLCGVCVLLIVVCASYKEERDIWKRYAEELEKTEEAERVYQEQDRQVLRLFET